MPGIFGLHTAPGHPAPFEKGFAGLADGMAQANKLTADRFVDKERRLGLGRASLGILNRDEQPVFARDGRLAVILHGELYNTPCSHSDPETVLGLYVERGEAGLVDLNGVFHLVIYDRAKEQLKLVSDKFGLSPLYYTVLPTGFVFAGEVRALLQEETVSREVDFRSIADFFHYGQILGNKTLFRSIQLLPPATVLTYDVRTHKVELQQYWRLEDQFVRNGCSPVPVGLTEVASHLQQAIQTRANGSEQLGISLSGGKDSRAILSGLGDRANGMPSYTLGLPGCADQKLAERMAKAAGTDHEFIPLRSDYLQSYQQMAHEMIRLSDGMYHPHESTEMLALRYFQNAKFDTLLRGHGGEIAKAALAYPVMVHPEVHTLQNVRSVLDYIYQKTNLVKRDIRPEDLFTPSFLSKTRGMERDSLQTSCGAVAHEFAPADVCIYYYIMEHIRRQVVASLEIFRSQIEVRLPYLDQEFITALLRLPVSERNTGEVHVELIRMTNPQLLRIPDSNTGAPLDAGKLRSFASDKIQAVSRRLSVMGFRHYTDFEKWYRTAFRSSIEEILFSQQFAGRDILDMKNLKEIYQQHVSGKKNYAHLLGTAVGIELWFRSFVDE